MEFYEDYYTEHPEEARRVLSKDGEYSFSDTGDPLLDKWEEELAKGLVPDLEEGLSPEEKEKLRKERGKSQRARQQADELVAKDPRMQSKFVTPGSKEEQALLRRHVLGGAQEPKTEADWEDLLMGHG